MLWPTHAVWRAIAVQESRTGPQNRSVKLAESNLAFHNIDYYPCNDNKQGCKSRYERGERLSYIRIKTEREGYCLSALHEHDNNAFVKGDDKGENGSADDSLADTWKRDLEQSPDRRSAKYQGSLLESGIKSHQIGRDGSDDIGNFYDRISQAQLPIVREHISENGKVLQKCNGADDSRNDDWR